MSFFSKKPEDQPLIVRDFDKLVCKPVFFRLHGKVFTLNPITVQEFWGFSEAMVMVQNLAQKQEVTVEELAHTYLKIFQSVCPSITLGDVQNMTQTQVAALLQFVVDTIKGVSQPEASESEKKNTQLENLQ